MSDSTTGPRWTDHDVSDPGVTLMQLFEFTVAALVLATAGAAVVRRRRVNGSTRCR